VRYVRNDTASVPAQTAATEAYFTQLLNADTSGSPIVIGIMMTDTYSAGAEYIRGLRTWQYDGAATPANKANRLKLHFSNVSFVGPNALADRLKNSKIPGTSDGYFTDNVVISQVVPNYLDDSSDVVRDYNRQIMLDGSTRSFTSLEGYISARLFIAGLEAHPGPFTAGAIVDSFEKLPDLGLGIGPTVGFSAANHQYSSSVWGTILQSDGSFKNLYFWSKDRPIQFFE
jgi:branched-chain amino acid transport system substrate-binding protein